MLITILAVVAALFVGAAIGMFAMALCAIGRRSDDRFAETMRSRMLEDDEDEPKDAA